MYLQNRIFFLPDKREREEEKKVHVMNNYESPKSF